MKNGLGLYKEMVQKTRQNDYDIEDSFLCFELWFLLHYECTKQSFEDCEPMKSALQKLNYCKKQKYLKNICRSLRQKLSTALENSKSL